MHVMPSSQLFLVPLSILCGRPVVIALPLPTLLELLHLVAKECQYMSETSLSPLIGKQR